MSDKYIFSRQIFTYQWKFCHEKEDENDNEKFCGSVSLFMSVVDVPDVVVVTRGPVFFSSSCFQFTCIFLGLKGVYVDSTFNRRERNLCSFGFCCEN